MIIFTVDQWRLYRICFWCIATHTTLLKECRSFHKHCRSISNRPGVPLLTPMSAWFLPGHKIAHSSILPSPSAQIRALCSFNDIMFNCQIFPVLKFKISVQYINNIASPDILIRPSLASSARIGFRSDRTASIWRTVSDRSSSASRRSCPAARELSHAGIVIG